MSQASGIPLEELRPHMFLLRDRDATSHLMRCAMQAFSMQSCCSALPEIEQHQWCCCSISSML